MNCHTTILKNCHDFFYGTHNAIFWWSFVSKQRTGLEKYKWVMEHMLLAKLNGSLQYTELWISKMVWMQNLELCHKFIAMIWCHLSTKDKVRWITKVASLWEKISWWAKFSKKKARLVAQIANYGVLLISSIANVLPLLGGDSQGGYGVVCKVQIKRFNHIPNTIELAGKTPKMDDKW
jgi:hypothetical protein